jgi:hypothetical protein
MADLKHVGRVKATGKKCIVVYRTLPGDAYNCLIAPTENLPDSYHDAMINLVESSTGQTANEFAEVMARSNFPDGSIMLAALHTQGRLVKASTDQIEMLPNNSYAILLSELNQTIAEQRGVPVDDLSIKSSLESKQAETKVETKPVVEEPTIPFTPEEQAKKYRSEADRLSKEAASLRRQAEDLIPTAKKAKVESEVEVSVTTTAPAKKATIAKSKEITS